MGGEARADLMLGAVFGRQKLKKARSDFQAAVATPYPCVSVLDGSWIVTTAATSRDPRKSVPVEPLRAIAEPETIAGVAPAAACAGARVLVIRNTVGDACAGIDPCCHVRICSRSRMPRLREDQPPSWPHPVVRWVES